MARLLALAAILLALSMVRSVFRADRFAIDTSGMLITNDAAATGLGATLTGVSNWTLIEVDRGNLVLSNYPGPPTDFTFAPDELGYWSSDRVTGWSRRSPPILHRTIGGQGFGLCFWVSWQMKQPPRTVGSTYLFSGAGGPNFQIALPLPLLVPAMALPFAIMTWQRRKRGRPKGFDIDVKRTTEQA